MVERRGEETDRERTAGREEIEMDEGRHYGRRKGLGMVEGEMK